MAAPVDFAAADCAALVPQLCARFFALGWVTGTGGGVTVRDWSESQKQAYQQHADDDEDEDGGAGDGSAAALPAAPRGRLYIAPSGVQKEAMQPSDIFVYEKVKSEEEDSGASTSCYCRSKHPEHPRCSGETDSDFQMVPTQNQSQINLMNFRPKRPSQCTPLFFNAFFMRSAGCVIHTHSQHAVLVTLLCQKKKDKSASSNDSHADSDSLDEFRIRNQEMIKGIRDDLTGKNLRFDDELVVPIIANTPEERDLQDSMADAMRRYPSTCAVLVRQHGVYVWGPDWVSAKTMAECYDYLFELAVKMHQLGIETV